MNRIILSDMTPLYAAAAVRDQYHTRAVEELRIIGANRDSVAIPTPILLETYNLLLRRLGIDPAHRWLNEVTEASYLVNPGEAEYRQASRRIQSYRDQPLTLFDGLLAILSERLDMPVWSYDHHMDVLGVRRWVPE